MTTTPEQTSPPREVPRRRSEEVGDFVRGQVTRLSRLYLEDTSQGVRTVARLASAAGKTVEHADLEVMGWTIDGLPGAAGTERTDSPAEIASHAAITLYALHQRSQRDRSAQNTDRTFATAVGRLYRSSTQGDGILRRFNATATAVSQAELLTHLRGLVQLLKRERLSFDYGLLAHDLLRAQTPSGADRVRLDWGREFYRVPADESEPSTDA